MSRASVNDAPTERQYRLLMVLGSGAALVVGTHREIDPLARRGWVAGDRRDSKSYPWALVRITPDGLRALARAVERYGLPEIDWPKEAEPREERP